MVATRTQGPTEIVADGQTGYLVAPDDDAALAAQLDALIADPSLRHRLGHAAAARATDLFSPAKNTRKIEAVLDDVFASRSARPPAAATVDRGSPTNDTR